MAAGIDEVGRGSLVGSVIAAAVILNPDKPIRGLADSKTLSPKRRAELAKDIEVHALAYAIGRAEASEVEHYNVLQASLRAMSRAYNTLSITPTWVDVDGTHYPEIACPGAAVIKGDQKIPAISAASILAKVYRDNEMKVLDALYPGYGFARHKGYATVDHIDRLLALGPIPLHRKTFAPVRRVLETF